MDDSNQSPASDHLRELVEAGAVDEAVDTLVALYPAAADDRKVALRTLRTVADVSPVWSTVLTTGWF
ncbi:hypothetical protein [Halohasta salina]|uniref:hypothetical protein n=1 Tax=Halohasta salina TaxID=2961621 RepID=UPI0020A52CE9|nr:hypothetical protein [Halohasta salina]